MSMTCRSWFCAARIAAVVVWCAAAAPAAGGDAPPPYDHQFGDKLLLSRPASGIKLDGKLDEPAWSTAQSIDQFPVPRGVLPLKTTVKAVHDDRCVYLGIVCTVPARDKIVAQHDEGGAVYRDDSIEIFLVSPEDEGAMQYCVSAAGKVLVMKVGGRQGSGREDHLEVAAGWDQASTSYVLEIAFNREKLGIPAGAARAAPISMIRNQEVGDSGSRQHRLLWRTNEPRTWGRLFLLDDASLAALREQWSQRLAAIKATQASAAAKANADGMLARIAALTTEGTDTVDFEKQLLELESRARDEHWRERFLKLFQDSKD